MKNFLFCLALALAAQLGHAQQTPEHISYSDQQAKAEQRLWNDPVWKKPYQATLSEDEKLAGLSRFWSEAKYNFAYFDKVPNLSWDSLYLATIPKVRAAPTTRDYYRVLQEMCAQLRDGHTNVYAPKELREETQQRPPLRTALVEGQVLLMEVNSETLRRLGLVPGQEVVAVDGVPVHDYAAQRAPLQSASTPQDRAVRTYTYTLLQGPARQPVALTLRDAKGRTFTKSVPRSGYPTAETAAKRPLLEVKLLKGNVGYVALNSFDDPALVPQFAQAYPQLSRTSALVIDVRANGGGNSDHGYAVLSYLTDQPFRTSRWMTREYHPAFRAWGQRPQWYSELDAPFPPKSAAPYTKPVVVLTSARTYSAAEDFAVAFDELKRGKIIGEPTGGSTGQPLSFALPGGGSARVCTKRDTYPDGKEFVGVGVQPQVVVRPTVRDVRSGRDAVLEAALKELKVKSKS